MQTTRIVLFVLSIVLSFHLKGAGSERLVSSVDLDKIVNGNLPGLNLKSLRTGGCSPVYHYERDDGKYLSIGFGVYRTVAEAQSLFRRTIYYPVLPTQTIPDLGDENVVWDRANERSRRVLFVRTNVVANLGSSLPREQLVHVARRIDDELKNGSPRVSFASRIIQPEITIRGLEPVITLPREGKKTFEINAEDVDILAFEANVENQLCRAGKRLKNGKASMVYSFHGEDCADTITLTLITKGNLIFTKKFPVKVKRQLTREPLTEEEKKQLAEAIAALKNPASDTEARVNAIAYVEMFEDKSAVPLLIEHLETKYHHHVRCQAARALAKIADPSATQHLLSALEKTRKEGEILRREIIIALGAIGDPAALPAIENFVNDEEEAIRMNARHAIYNIKQKSMATQEP